MPKHYHTVTAAGDGDAAWRRETNGGGGAEGQAVVAERVLRAPTANISAQLTAARDAQPRLPAQPQPVSLNSVFIHSVVTTAHRPGMPSHFHTRLTARGAWCVLATPRLRPHPPQA